MVESKYDKLIEEIEGKKTESKPDLKKIEVESTAEFVASALIQFEKEWANRPVLLRLLDNKEQCRTFFLKGAMHGVKFSFDLMKKLNEEFKNNKEGAK